MKTKTRLTFAPTRRARQNLLVAALVSELTFLSLVAGSVTAAPNPTAEPTRRDLAAIKAEQAALTPAQVLADLQKGNERFASGKIKPRDMLHDSRSPLPANIRTPSF